MAYYKKFDLIDIYESHLLDGYLPELVPSQEVTNSKGAFNDTYIINKYGDMSFTLKANFKTASISQQLLTGIIANSKRTCYGKATEHRVSVYYGLMSENDYVDVFNNVIDTINAMKSTMKYANTFNEELEKALKYSYNCFLNGKGTPKLSLRIKDLNQIKGMTPIQKRNLVYNIVESVLFDDDFNKFQKRNHLQGRHGYGRYNASVDQMNSKKYTLWKTLKREYDKRKVVE